MGAQMLKEVGEDCENYWLYYPAVLTILIPIAFMALIQTQIPIQWLIRRKILSHTLRHDWA